LRSLRGASEPELPVELALLLFELVELAEPFEFMVDELFIDEFDDGVVDELVLAG
jgi:hypothetical protein